MCQRRNSKCKLASNLERGGSAGTSEVTSNICRSNVEESEAREFTGRHISTQSRAEVGWRGFQLLHCPQNELHSMVMSHLALKRFKPRLDGSF